MTNDLGIAASMCFVTILVVYVMRGVRWYWVPVLFAFQLLALVNILVSAKGYYCMNNHEKLQYLESK